MYAKARNGAVANIWVKSCQLIFANFPRVSIGISWKRTAIDPLIDPQTDSLIDYCFWRALIESGPTPWPEYRLLASVTAYQLVQSNW